MTDQAALSATRFGRTVIEVLIGELVEQPVQAIVYPTNARGVMGAGPSGSVRTVAGAEVEREAMSQAPIALGSAIVTSPGKLAEHGVEVILHAAVAPVIGEHSIDQAVYRGLDAALTLAIERKIRSIAIPLIGASADDPESERHALAEGIVNVVVKRLRQRGVRLERVLFVVRFEDDQRMLTSVIQRARERVWTTSA